MTMEKQLYTVKEFVELTGISQTRAYEIANSRYGGFKKIGRRLYISNEVLRKKYDVNNVKSVPVCELDDEFKAQVRECIYEIFREIVLSEEAKRIQNE